MGSCARSPRRVKEWRISDWRSLAASITAPRAKDASGSAAGGDSRCNSPSLRLQPRSLEACCRRLEPIAFSKLTHVTFAAPRTSTCVMP